MIRPRTNTRNEGRVPGQCQISEIPEATLHRTIIAEVTTRAIGLVLFPCDVAACKLFIAEFYLERAVSMEEYH